MVGGVGNRKIVGRGRRVKEEMLEKGGGSWGGGGKGATLRGGGGGGGKSVSAWTHWGYYVCM